MPQPALPEGAVSVGLLGSVGQHWPLLLVCILFWLTLENEEGGEHLPPPQSPQFDMN